MDLKAYLESKRASQNAAPSQPSQVDLKAYLDQKRNADIDSWKVPIDEMHPDLTFADRAIVKNFASSPQKGVAYLQQQHPNMKFRVVDGEIQARKPEEDRYRVLDPSGLDWQDVTDVVSDVGQGAAEAAGTVLGGAAGLIGGAAAGTPFAGVGAIPGAVAGTATGQAIGRGLLGGASEYAKQGIGSALGIPDNVNHTNAGISATASALMPVVGERVIKPAYNYTKNTVAPFVASTLSGIDKDIIKNINVDDVARKYIANTGVAKYLNNTSGDIQDALRNLKNKYGSAVDMAGPDSVDIRPAKEIVTASLNQSRPSLIPEHQSQADAILNLMNSYGNSPSTTEMLTGKNGPIKAAPSQARAIRDTLGDYIGVPAREVPFSTQNAASEGLDAIKDSLIRNAKDPEAFKIANGEYSNFMNEIRTNSNLKKLGGYNKNADDSLNLAQILTNKYDKETFKNMPKKQAQDEAFRLIGEAGGPDMNQLAREYASHNIFQDPKLLPGKGFMENARGGAIGTGIGTAAGYLTTGNYAGGLVGGGLGGVGGQLISSPYVIKGVAQGTKAAESAINNGVNKLNNISPYILKTVPKSIYNMLDGREY